MLRTVIAWVLVAVCAAWLVVRAFGLERGYPMVPLLAFTPLAVGGAVVAAVIAAVLGRRAAAAVAVVVAVGLAAMVAPRALGGASGAEGGTAGRLRVLTANVYQRAARGAVAGGDGAREQPDVVSVQELTPRVAARELGATLLPAPRHRRARAAASGPGCTRGCRWSAGGRRAGRR